MGKQLALLLLKQPIEVLKTNSDKLEESLSSENGLLRAIGHAGLIVSGQRKVSLRVAKENDASAQDFLQAVSLIPQSAVRNSLRDEIITFLPESQSNSVRSSAIQALSFVTAAQDQTFQLLGKLISEKELRKAAIQTMLTIPQKERNRQLSQKLVEQLVKIAEETPAAKRTTDAFIDQMQFVDQLLSVIPTASAKTYRSRLREISVRVVKIQTVEEEMRYDLSYFAVEAGRPVQIILQNEDLMPHNFVITKPDTLKDVALDGAVLGPNPGFEGKLYVPKSENVLFATSMVQAHQQERLTFTAPREPGEYPYVCTFPRHWMRMYGVMVVVDDLDVWLKNPIKPKDPIGSNREFIQAWKVEDFKEGLLSGITGTKS